MNLPQTIFDHPLIAAWLGLVFLLILLLGVLHVSRIFGGFLLLVIREFKHELLGIGRVLGRVKDELTTWRSEE